MHGHFAASNEVRQVLDHARAGRLHISILELAEILPLVLQDP
jgi:hypothetical protein